MIKKANIVTGPYRICFDTSVYIVALLSPEGAAGALVRLAESKVVRMVVSEEVIVESDQVLGKKFPDLIGESRKLWKHIGPEIAPSPPPNEIKRFAKNYL